MKNTSEKALKISTYSLLLGFIAESKVFLFFSFGQPCFICKELHSHYCRGCMLRYSCINRCTSPLLSSWLAGPTSIFKINETEGLILIPVCAVLHLMTLLTT